MNQKQQYKNPQLKQEARQQYIKDHMLLMTQEELAQELNVDRSTIRRDMGQLYETTDFRDMVISQYIEHFAKARLKETDYKICLLLTKLFKYLPQNTAEHTAKEIKLSLDDQYIKDKALEIEQLKHHENNP
jgi:DNA-binding transcriptional MocR family regulator